MHGQFLKLTGTDIHSQLSGTEQRTKTVLGRLMAVSHQCASEHLTVRLPHGRHGAKKVQREQPRSCTKWRQKWALPHHLCLGSLQHCRCAAQYTKHPAVSTLSTQSSTVQVLRLGSTQGCTGTTQIKRCSRGPERGPAQLSTARSGQQQGGAARRQPSTQHMDGTRCETALRGGWAGPGCLPARRARGRPRTW